MGASIPELSDERVLNFAAYIRSAAKREDENKIMDIRDVVGVINRASSDCIEGRTGGTRNERRSVYLFDNRGEVGSQHP